MNKQSWFCVLVLCLLAACAAQPRNTPVGAPPASPRPDDHSLTPPATVTEEPTNPYAPGKGDEAMQRGEVFIDTQEILTLESVPLQYRLHLSGSLPTPCHQLRVVVDRPDAQNRIQVQVFSLTDPKTSCIQVLEPFEASLPLGSFPSGSFTVLVNGQQAGAIAPK